MKKIIKILVIILSLLQFSTVLAVSNNRDIILKNNDFFEFIKFDTSDMGKIFYKDNLIIDISKIKKTNSQVDQVDNIHLINLIERYYISFYYDFTTNGYLVNKKNGEINKSCGGRWNYCQFLSESTDGKYMILYYIPEDAPEDSQYGDYATMFFQDTQSPNIIMERKVEHGLPKNFTIDDNYQFSFEDKTGIVKGNLLDYFGVNKIATTTEVKDDKRSNTIYLIIGGLIALLAGIFVGKRYLRK